MNCTYILYRLTVQVGSNAETVATSLAPHSLLPQARYLTRTIHEQILSTLYLASIGQNVVRVDLSSQGLYL